MSIINNQAFNFHSHTHYSDGQAAPTAFAQAAMEQGLKAYGYTDHAPVPFPCSWTIPTDRVEAYCQEIRALQEYHRADIELYLGLEVDFIPGVISVNHSSITRLHLDYTIGSVHFVDQYPDGSHWGFEDSKKIFQQGIDQIFNGDVQKAVSRYYQLIREMVATRPTIIGHLDRIKMHNLDQRFFKETDAWYRKEVIATLDQIQAEGLIMEINTKGFFPGQDEDPYPSFWIIQEAIQRNIKMHLGADAHHPLDVNRAFSYLIPRLRAMGLQSIYTLTQNQWVAIPLTD
ncbi:MAG: histidinol-phosphatase [Bacteroidota bacterium]